VRHPGYIGGAAAFLFIPFILTSLWTLIPAACIIAGYFVRTGIEDRTLQAELEGYSDYAQRVRFRWIPGIW
jgi:protein-S-isoprenylcysteine O-methyltransferase Ste14